MDLGIFWYCVTYSGKELLVLICFILFALYCRYTFYPLNAELNLICHLLVLLGDLTFMGPCIVSIIQYISNKMQRYKIHLYLETALHISGESATRTCRAVSRYK
jgi:hypothetical protein